MNLDRGVWVILAGKSRFLLLRNKGARGAVELEIYEQATCEEGPAPGPSGLACRTPRPPGSGTGKVLSVHDMNRGRRRGDGISFADRTGAKLRAWAALDRSRQLLVVAETDTLGRLRNGYDANLKWVVVAEIARDLTDLPLARIEAEIRAHDLH